MSSSSSKTSQAQTSHQAASPIISNTRAAIESSISTVVQAENSFIASYNDTASEINKSLDSFKSSVCSLRRQYGREIVLGAAATSFLLTLPFSRFAAFRNAALAGMGAGFLVAPATTVGLVLQAKHSIENSNVTVKQWTKHGQHAVGDVNSKNQ